MLYGAMVGLKRGVQRAKNVWVNGLDAEAMSKLDFVPKEAIKGKVGEIVRIPTRVLGVMDEFFKTVLGSMEMHAQAYRKAVSEGTSGASRLNRIAELINEPTEDMIKSMEKTKLAGTYQE